MLWEVPCVASLLRLEGCEDWMLWLEDWWLTWVLMLPFLVAADAPPKLVLARWPEAEEETAALRGWV